VLHVGSHRAAVAALEERLRGGDVVLVKASHSVGLQAVALALTGEQPLPARTEPADPESGQ
jgi:UDP-N-acetylmuramoyl-tripeptide--D-alanyl-D-alanine ligase